MLSGLRIAIQAALLYEVRDPLRAEIPVSCAYCNHVVPDMPFCPRCGVSSGAAPLRAAVRGSVAATGVCTARRFVFGCARSSFQISWCCGRHVSGPRGASAHSRFCCRRRSAHRVRAVPVPAGLWPSADREAGDGDPRFTAVDGEFSVAYPGGELGVRSRHRSQRRCAELRQRRHRDHGAVRSDSLGRSPRQLADDLIERNYPDATVAYEMPNASVGYQPGYGVVADVYPQNPDGRYVRLRVLVLVAIKNDYVDRLRGGAVPSLRPGLRKRSSVGEPISNWPLDMGQYVNSFRWRGDPLR